MAKTTKAINVSIGASLKDLEQAMRDAGIMVEDFSVKAQKAGKKGEEGFGSLEKGLKGFRREQVQEGRLVGFYVKELADFTSMSDSAKNVVGGLGQTLLAAATGGLSFGLAFEAAKLVIGIISESLAQATKEAEATAAAILKIQQRIDAIGKSKRQVMLEEISQLSSLLKEMDDANQALGDAGGQGSGSAEDVRWDKANAALQKYAKDHQTTVAALVQTEKKLWEEYRATESADQNKADIAKAVADENAAQERLKTADGMIKAIHDKEIAAHKAKLAEKARLDAAAAKNQNRIGLDDAQARGLADAAGEEDGVTGNKPRQSYFTDAAKNAEKAMEGVRKKGVDAAMAMADAWNAVGSALDTTFSAIGNAVGGTAGNFIAQIGRMISQVLGLIVALATASALQSGPAGWIIALPAAASILAGVIGMIAGAVTARADGGWIEGGRPYLVGERGPELVVPNGSGTVIPNHALGGGGITVNVSATDAGSFERMLRRNDNALVRVLRDSQRSGRG